MDTPLIGLTSSLGDPSAAGSKEGAGKPIERSAKQEEEGAQGGITQAAILDVLLIGALAVAGFVVLRRC
jgi:hypothetical protein